MRNIPETVHEYNIPRLNIWFIVSSFILLLCVGWVLWDDYMRAWKPFQREAKKIEVQKLEIDRTAAEKRMQEAGYAEVGKKLAEATTVLKSKELEKEIAQKVFEKYRSDMEVKQIEFNNAKALLDQRKSEFDEAVETARPKKLINEREVELRKQEAEVTRINLQIQDLKVQLNAAQIKLDGYVEAKAKLEKEKGRLETERDLISKKITFLTDKKFMILDSPLIEFAKPTVSVKQIIAQDQTYSLNFVDVPRIDRCITCHTFSQKKDSTDGDFKFATLPQPWRAHPRLDLFLDPASPHPIETFGCSTCHLGWDRGTSFITAAHNPSFKKIQKDYVSLPLVEGKNRWATEAEIENWKPGLASKAKEYQKLVEEKNALESAAVKSPERLAELKASIKKVKSEVESQHGMSGEMLHQFKFASMTQEHAWHDMNWHQVHHKEDPMRPREFFESSCLKCHQGETDIPRDIATKRVTDEEIQPGDKLTAGLRLIEQAGCWACHEMQALKTTSKYKLKPNDTLETVAHAYAVTEEAILHANGTSDPSKLKTGQEITIPVRTPLHKPGPSLTKIASKTSKEWMVKWLENPKGFRPNTYMPQFWNLDNNRDGTTYDGTMTDEKTKKPVKIDWADRNAVERQAITEYLFKLSEKPTYSTPPSGDLTRGEALVKNVGCMGCHVVDTKLSELSFKDKRYRTRGPMLFGAGSKYNGGWLYAWLKNPYQYQHGTMMPNLRLSDQEAADITAYLMKVRNEEFDQKQVSAINKAVLKDTYVEYRKDELPPKESRLTQFQLALDSAARTSEQEQLEYLGAKLVDRYGCMNCHEVPGMLNAKPISIELSNWASKRPSQLDFGFIEMPHDTYSFLHQKLAAPRSLDRVDTKRPQELMRMPQYHFTEDQIELIMIAVMGMTGENPSPKVRRNLTQDEWYIENGRWLIKEYNCKGCHINELTGGSIRSVQDDSEPQFYPPSLDGVGLKVRPDWLHAFIKSPGEHKYREWMKVRMPTYNFTEDQINTLTRYFALRDKQTYPIDDYKALMGQPPSKEDMELGARIIKDKAKCYSCHEPRNSEEAGIASPAIHLDKPRSRMRPNAVPLWVHHADKITPGTRMTLSFWPADGSPLPDYPGDLNRQVKAVSDYILWHGSPTKSGGGSTSK